MIYHINEQTWLLWIGLLHCQKGSPCKGIPTVEEDDNCSSWENGEGKGSTFSSCLGLSICWRSEQIPSEFCECSSRSSSSLCEVLNLDEDISICSWPCIRDDVFFLSVSCSLFKSRICCKITDVFCCPCPL